MLRRRPSRDGACDLFVLGAYPSAVHVRWRPPDLRHYLPIAVDNEPTPFWTADASAAEEFSDDRQYEEWLRMVAGSEIPPAEWGEFKPGGIYNGTSGRWVRDHVLRHFGCGIDHTCITDCIDYYCWKFGPPDDRGQGGLVAEEYAPRAAPGGWPEARIPRRPTPASLVRAALERPNRTRLEQELDDAKASKIVTLGSEPFLVLRGLLAPEEATKVPPNLPLDSKGYGMPLLIVLRERSTQWWPLIHPGNKHKPHQKLHDEWRRA